MERRLVYLGSIEKAIAFITALGKVEASASLISGWRTVNAKSVLGVLSLDLDKILILEISGSKKTIDLAEHAVGSYIIAKG